MPSTNKTKFGDIVTHYRTIISTLEDYIFTKFDTKWLILVSLTTVLVVCIVYCCMKNFSKDEERIDYCDYNRDDCPRRKNLSQTWDNYKQFFYWAWQKFRHCTIILFQNRSRSFSPFNV